MSTQEKNKTTPEKLQKEVNHAPENPGKGVKLTDDDLKKVMGSGEFDDVPTVVEHPYDDDIKNRV